MKKKLLILVSVLLITGCATPKVKQMSKNMNNASLGMTKKEIIQVMGEPQSVSATSGVEYLKYKL